MKPSFKQPNIKGPRFRWKVEKGVDRDFFERLKKVYPDLTISKKDVRIILNTFHELCNDVIAENRDGLELLEQLGYILIGKMKVKEFYSKDTTKSIQYNRPLDFTNWESNGWICKIYYSNFASKYRFKNAKFWGFEASRPLKKKVSKAFIKNHTQYIVADDYKRISKVFRQDAQKLRIKLQIQKNNSK